MANKKRIEEHQLNLFRSLVPDFPEGTVTSTEEPDFLIEGSTSTIGIELTTLHRPVPSGTVPVQASEAMNQRIIERAATLYAENGGVPVRCTAHMSCAHARKDDVEAAASAIANWVLRHVPAENTTVEFDEFPGNPLLDRHVASLSVHRFDFIAEPFFSVAGATWVPMLTRNEIDGALRAKEAKHPAYRKKCDSVWLVIITGYGPTSTWFNVTEDVSSLGSSTVFDRVYVLEGFGPKLLRLAQP